MGDILPNLFQLDPVIPIMCQQIADSVHSSQLHIFSLCPWLRILVWGGWACPGSCLSRLLWETTFVSCAICFKLLFLFRENWRIRVTSSNENGEIYKLRGLSMILTIPDATYQSLCGSFPMLPSYPLLIYTGWVMGCCLNLQSQQSNISVLLYSQWSTRDRKLSRQHPSTLHRTPLPWATAFSSWALSWREKSYTLLIAVCMENA